MFSQLLPATTGASHAAASTAPLPTASLGRATARQRRPAALRRERLGLAAHARKARNVDGRHHAAAATAAGRSRARRVCSIAS